MALAVPLPELAVGAEKLRADFLRIVLGQRHAVARRRILHEARGGLAVKQAEVHGLRELTVFFRHRLARLAEHRRRCAAMEILAALIRLDHFRFTGDGSGGAQLDLRVVGDDELAALGRDEALAQRAASDVLQIGFAAAETAGRGAGRLEPPVDASIRRNALDERDRLLRLFLRSAICEDERHEPGVAAFLERFLVGAGDGDSGPLQRRLKLLRARHVERRFVEQIPEGDDFCLRVGLRLVADGFQFGAVHRHARPLHRDDHRQQRHLQFGHVSKIVLLDLQGEHAVERMEMSHVARGVGELIVGEKHAAPVGGAVIVARGDAEIAIEAFVEIVAGARAGDEQARRGQRAERPPHPDAAFHGEPEGVELQVVADDEHRLQRR